MDLPRAKSWLEAKGENTNNVRILQTRSDGSSRGPTWQQQEWEKSCDEGTNRDVATGEGSKSAPR